MKITRNELFRNASVSLLNSREDRYRHVYPTTKKARLHVDGTEVKISTNVGDIVLDRVDEVVLRILCTFRYIPIWLVRRWYESETYDIIGDGTRVSRLVANGLVYQLPSPVGVLLIPTNFCASLFGLKLGPFYNPSFNTLSHTISEQSVMFDCIMGKADYLDKIDFLEFESKLGLGKFGNLCVPESEYSVRNCYFRSHIQEFNDQEAKLINEMVNGELMTSVDLKEHKLTIHKKLNQYDYDLKIPDLAVLAKREVKDGVALPRSVALEVELTNKGHQAYRRIIEIYWSNLRYGRVVYLVSEEKTYEEFVKAYQQATKELDKSKKTCEFKICEFKVPYDRSQLECVK